MKRRSRKRRILRIAGWMGAAVLALLALTFLFQGPLVRWLILPGVEAELSRALGLDVRIGGASIDLRGLVTITDLEASGTEPATGVRAVSLNRASVSFSPLALLGGRGISIEKVRLEAPLVDLDLDRDPILPDTFAGSDPEVPGDSNAAPLPVIEVVSGGIRLAHGGETLELGGVDFTLRRGTATLSMASAGGSWTLPRPGALEMPLSLEARLAEGPEPWREILIERLSLGAREVLLGLRVRVQPGGEVLLEGGLPGVNARMVAGSIGDGMLDLNFDLQGADPGAIVPFFTDWISPRGRATGGLRFLLPLDRPVDWGLSADLEIVDLAWPEAGLAAAVLRAAVHRGGPEPVLEGEFLAAGVSWREMLDVDIVGEFRRVEDGGGGRVDLRDVFVERGESAVSVSGSILEAGLVFEDGRVALRGLRPSDLKDFLPSMAGVSGVLDAEVFGRGGILDPASCEASGALSFSGAAPGAERCIDLRLETSLAACELRIEEGVLSSGQDGDEVAFTLASSIPSGTNPAFHASFQRLEGVLGGFPVEVTGLPEINVDASTYRLEPSEAQVLGGRLRFEASGDYSGGASFGLLAEGIEIGRLSKVLPLPLGAQGSLSLEVGLTLPGEADAGEREAELSLSLEDASVDLGGSRLEGLSLGARIVARENVLEVERIELSNEGGIVLLSGSVPIAWTTFPAPLPGSEVDVDFRASIDRLAKLPVPRETFRDLDGRLILAGQTLIPLSGDRAFRPADLRAVIDLSGGIVKRFDDSPPLTDLQVRLRLAGGDVVLEKFSGKAQGSPFDVTGGFQVALPWDEGGAAFRTLDLHLVSRGALLLRQPDLRVRGDIDVRWTGPLDRSLLAGSVTLTRAYYFHDIPLTPRRGARLPLRLFSLRAPFDRLRFDIKVTSDRAIWVRNNMIMTRASANLRLGGTGHEPMLTGTITTDEGRVRFATASLNISTSLVEFLPADPLNPRLQIALNAEVRGYSVFVSITGSLEEPEVLLDSSPPLEREKVLVLITTGLTLDEIEERGVDRVAAVQAAKYAVYRLANYFSHKDPLEKSFFGRFSLETESARSSEYDDLIRVEYKVAEGILLERDELFFQSERDTYGDYNFNVGLRFELEP